MCVVGFFLAVMFAYVAAFPRYHGAQAAAVVFSFLYAPVLLSSAHSRSARGIPPRPRPPRARIINTTPLARISNFLLWQLAYTEFYFTPVPWPDFTKEELIKAVEAYNHRDRRHGGFPAFFLPPRTFSPPPP